MNKHLSLGRFALPAFVTLLYLFLYIPIIVLIVFSFNNSDFPYEWHGFTFRWYNEIFASPEIWNALKNSSIVAFSSVALSLTMGSLIVFFGSRTWFSRIFFLFYGGLAAPEIAVAVALLGLFTLLFVPLGLTTLIVSHTVLGLGYVVPMLQTRMEELDYALTEASLDLGATKMQTFRYVILPLLTPALLGSALLTFIISWDDFIISFFCSGASAQTLPMYIFSMIRSGSSPVVNALSTMLLIVSSLIVVLFSLLNVNKSDIMR